MSTATAHKLTQKQRERLEEISKRDGEAKVIGWDEDNRGPFVRLHTGAVVLVTRAGTPQVV